MSELLEQIDQVVAGWEARPESWLPGDPLYARPRGGAWGEQTIRPMIDLIEDVPSAYDVAVRCVDCGVSWSGYLPCWMCGQEQPGVALLAQLLAGIESPAVWQPVAEEQLTVESLQRAMEMLDTQILVADPSALQILRGVNSA